ncbi:MAG: aminotransferase class III-fold pyridoxal phosphate-dependent enzyme [Steroidobacteraceae bacterium]
MDKVGAGGLGGTYAGNPLACAAALAVLDVFEKEKLLDRSIALGAIVALPAPGVRTANRPRAHRRHSRPRRRTGLRRREADRLRTIPMPMRPSASLRAGSRAA